MADYDGPRSEGQPDGTLPDGTASAGTAPAGTAPAGTPPDDAIVVGVGNDLRGDDGVGRAVVKELTRVAVPGLRAIWSHQLVPELVESIAGTRLAVFVDAVHPGSTPPAATGIHEGDGAGGDGAGGDGADVVHVGGGGVVVRPVRPRPPSVGGHQAEPGALLGLADLAGLPVPQAYLVSVPGHDFELGSQLSPPTRAALPSAVHAVLRLLGQHRRADSRSGPARTASDGA